MAPERTDVGFAIVASTIANIYRDRKRRAKPFDYHDFLPKYGEEEREEQTEEEMKEVLKAWTLVLGGEIKDRGHNRQVEP